MTLLLLVIVEVAVDRIVDSFRSSPHLEFDAANRPYSGDCEPRGRLFSFCETISCNVGNSGEDERTKPSESRLLATAGDELRRMTFAAMVEKGVRGI